MRRSFHRTSVPNIWLVWPAQAPPMVLRWLTMNCMRGVCWSASLGAGAVLLCDPRSLPCRSFSRKRFSPINRTVLSVISLVAYVLTKLAVGIFAGGVVFAVMIPDVTFMGLDSFWIGSIAVIVLTGVYTIMGGMRAVAYTSAIQTVILVLGSAFVTYFGLKALGGWGALREWAGSEMFNLWKPMVPEGVESTWAPVKESTRMAWYFNDNYPWVGMLFCAPIIGLWYWCTDQYIVQRVLGATK